MLLSFCQGSPQNNLPILVVSVTLVQNFLTVSLDTWMMGWGAPLVFRWCRTGRRGQITTWFNCCSERPWWAGEMDIQDLMELKQRKCKLLLLGRKNPVPVQAVDWPAEKQVCRKVQVSCWAIRWPRASNVSSWQRHPAASCAAWGTGSLAC